MSALSARDRVTFAVKSAVAHALYLSGLLGLILRARLRRRAVVLMYHRVLTPEEQAATASQPGLVVQVATFRRHLEVLRRHCQILSADEFVAHVERRTPFARPSCLITFDDGWLDNLHNALPVLREQQCPALIFLPVHFIGTGRMFVRERLTRLLIHAVRAARSNAALAASLRADLAPLGLQGVLDFPDEGLRARVIEAVRVHRYANGPEFEALVTSLAGRLGSEAASEPSPDAFIDWDQVAQMARDGIAFGGHGADHRVLTQVDADTVRREVATSKAVLDTRLPSPVVTFAYPGGGWNRAVAEAVRDGGYRVAFTIDAGYVACDDDPLALKRVSVHDDITRSTPMFMARLAGVF